MSDFMDEDNRGIHPEVNSFDRLQHSGLWFGLIGIQVLVSAKLVPAADLLELGPLDPCVAVALPGLIPIYPRATHPIMPVDRQTAHLSIYFTGLDAPPPDRHFAAVLCPDGGCLAYLLRYFAIKMGCVWHGLPVW